MSTICKSLNHFSGFFLRHFVLAKLATLSIRVNKHHTNTLSETHVHKDYTKAQVNTSVTTGNRWILQFLFHFSAIFLQSRDMEDVG